MKQKHAYVCALRTHTDCREKSTWTYWVPALLSFLFFAVISLPQSFAAAHHAENNPRAEDSLLAIRGRVVTTEEPPLPLQGATVQIKGSTQGVSTDADGYFSIMAKKGDVLAFSMVGYQPNEYIVTRAISTLSIPLKEDAGSMGEVIVTGMTEQQRKHIASSVATLDVSSNIASKPITQLSQALQGGVTGIQVTQGSGIPGRDAAQIWIRGIGTTGNSNPLILVDGIPMDMNDIDPLTVESITVLKDAAAAASYGSRAANGVIVVTTKRGVPGRVAVTYDGYYGVQSSTFLPNTADGPVYMRMANEARANSGLGAMFTDQVIQKTISGEDPLRYPNTNWLDLMINRAAPITNHSLSVSGGNNLARFAVTGNYIYQEGMLPVTSSQRFNLRANTSVTLSDKFVVNLDMLAIRGDRKEPQRPSNDTYGGNRLMEDLYRVPPYILPRYPDRDGKPFYQSYLTLANPLAVVEQNGYQRWREDVTSVNIQPKWRIFPGFNLKGQFNYRVNSTHNTEFSDGFVFFDYFSGNQVAPTNWTSKRTSSIGRNTYFFLSGSADYSYRRKGHNLFAIAGISQEQSAEGDWNQWSILSAYSKINYAFRDKYMLELAGRMDGSSRFGLGNKFGFFPSIAAGWNVHNEDFMQDVDFVSNLKLRASYGTLGNQNIGLYQYQSPIQTSNGLETRFGNPNITWESVDMLDIGMDLGLLQNKLEITLDYYRKLTRDMLQNPEVSLVGGMIRPDQVTTPSNPPVNSGNVLNSGFELAVNYFEQLNKNLKLSFRPGLTWNKNKVTDLPGIVMTTPNQTEWMIRTNQIGYPIRSYYGYLTDGLLKASDFDAAGNPLIPVISSVVKPGDIKYIDRNEDGKITEEDMTILANQTPRLNYFANIGITYRKFDFQLLLQGTGKSAAALSGMMALPLDESFDGGIPTEYYSNNYWTPERTDARFPRLRAQPTDNKFSSDFWLENGAYLRFKYIQAGYTFDNPGMKRFGINAIRLYLNAQNAFTITSIRLMDPESRGNQWSYPIMRMYTFGLNVKF